MDDNGETTSDPTQAGEATTTTTTTTTTTAAGNTLSPAPPPTAAQAVQAAVAAAAPAAPRSSSLHSAGGRNPIKKRSRSAPWTVPEMLTLIDAKRKEREWCQMYKRGVKLPAAERWRIVAAHMEAKDMGRTGSQCQDKWENMMKDYKAVRDWQCMIGGAAKNYFKDMTNKERKDANLPPQMDEIVFYSLHAIQSEKEEKKEIDLLQQQQQRENTQPPLVVPLVQHKDKEGSDEADVNSIDSDTSGRKRARRLVMDHHQQQQQQQQPASVFAENPVVFDNFVHASSKDGSKEFIDCFMKVLEKSDRSPDTTTTETKKKSKDTALLTRALVALADAVKMVAQKL
ncbi:uncharacterized protein LOC9645106 [Selaginella moellendorffii]|uniref:uncharacterized protein LOC9645106 n=1 Tax=Selaginella moellendorffii TaxID=88036 RepID=UPI000D1CE8A9|nr:uncharacterized protein LOC9645106 [Selaginella moellendorffii]|eukprot:XP_024545720.1 uncharacterized protein LOC9645106 [Selaginella moellendorffii]